MISTENLVVPLKEDPGFWERNFLDFWTGEKKELFRRLLFGIFIFALLIRIPLLLYPEVIHNDGTEYVRHARRILSGDWSPGRSHPLYPSLIALAHFVTPTDEIAGILISVIFGALIVFPVFSLGKRIFDERVGILAALLAAVHPFLYVPSGSVLTESTFHFLFATSVLYGWKAFDQSRWKDIVLFALLTSLAYLTRPEAIAFLAVFGFWVFWINPTCQRRAWTKRMGILLLAVIAFLAFSSFYLLQLRKETGRWQISKKVSVSVGSLSEEEGGLSVEMLKTKKQFQFSSLVREPWIFLKKIMLGLLQSLYKFQQVYTPLLTILLILGFILSRGKPFSRKVTYYLFSYLIMFFGFIHPFFWITRRYTSHVIAICLPWAAFGFVETMNWAHQRFREKGVWEKIAPVLLGVLLVILFVQGRVIHTREHRFIQREAGYWMKDHLPRGAKVMSSEPQEAFYAELPWARTPQGSYEEILKSARAKGARYLLVDDEVEQMSPGFWGKVRKDEMVSIKDLKKKARRIVIFELVHPIGQ